MMFFKVPSLHVQFNEYLMIDWLKYLNIYSPWYIFHLYSLFYSSLKLVLNFIFYSNLLILFQDVA